ncbi:MAG TPA: dihydroorotate dehydrogenase, partial [Acidimicrobiia bacterium]|nr:dihydroorotate dehydrogenase [Acidimicrobiia bacterium]
MKLGRRPAALPDAAVDLTCRLGPLTLPNPIVAASGTYGHGDEVARLGDPAKLGAVTAKSLSPYPWEGNPAPRVWEATAGMLNSVGLQNPGVEAWIEHDLPPLLARGARVIVSVWGRSVDDYAKAAAALAPAVARLTAVEVNVSCPNLEDRGHMFAAHPDATAAAVGAVLDQVPPTLPVFAKLSPNVTDLVAVAAAAVGAGAVGLTLINTVLGLAIDAETRRPRLGAGGGGLSGPAIKPVALRAVADVARALPGTPIIGTGGVRTGLEAVEMLLAGASAVGVGTATFFDPRAAEEVAAGLARWCAEHGVARSA